MGNREEEKITVEVNMRWMKKKTIKDEKETEGKRRKKKKRWKENVRKRKE